MEWMTPVGRGFDTSFGYLGGAEDHFKHTNKEAGCEGVDLWDSDRPANRSTWDGVYSSHMYKHQVKAVIQEHGARQRNQATHERQPFFLYVALQDMHAPNEVPAKYSRQFSKYTDDFGLYNGMGTAADDVFGNMTAALHHQGLYNNTLIVMVRASCCVVALTWGMSGERQRWPCCDDRVLAHGQCTIVVFILIATAFVVVVSSCCDAELAVEGWQANGAWGRHNSFSPNCCWVYLVQDFEGGIRTVSFVGGGFLAQHTAQGAKNRDQYVHAAGTQNASWYPQITSNPIAVLQTGTQPCAALLVAMTASTLPLHKGSHTRMAMTCGLTSAGPMGLLLAQSLWLLVAKSSQRATRPSPRKALCAVVPSLLATTS